MLNYHGNLGLLNFKKIGFLSSQTDPFCCDDVLLQFIRNIRKDEVIITPGHSYMEKQLMSLIHKEGKSVIWVMARGIPDLFHVETKRLLDDQRLLIISPFEKDQTQITGYRSMMRNRFIIDICDNIIIGYVRKYGLLEELLEDKTFIQLYK